MYKRICNKCKKGEMKNSSMCGAISQRWTCDYCDHVVYQMPKMVEVLRDI